MVKALTFDVFGTVVDWRTSIINEGCLLNSQKGWCIDWGLVADEWRAGYHQRIDQIRKKQIPWQNVDSLHRDLLDDLVSRYGMRDLSEGETDQLNRVWHRLNPWPDAVDGLRQMRTHYTVAALSNGNMELLVDMAKNSGLAWDCLLPAGLSGHYKTDPEVYQMASRVLNLPEDQIMMVACHPRDLRGAKAVGMRTAYVHRPLENGLAVPFNPAPNEEFDVVASDFVDLARRLRAVNS